MHTCRYYSHSHRLETSSFTLPTGSSEYSQNKLSKCLGMDPGVRRNSQPVPLIGK